jgi:hypothetical protein
MRVVAIPSKAWLAEHDYDAAMMWPSFFPERPRLALGIVLVPLFAACAPTTEAASAPAVTAPSPASLAPAPTAPSPPPPPASATDVLSQGRAPFDACYALARKTRPDLPRTSVEITFSMDDTGKLLNVDLAYRNRMDDAAKDCMRTAAEGLKFPPSLHGKQTGTIVFTPP